MNLLSCERHAQSVMKNLGGVGKERVTMEIATPRKQILITCSDFAFSFKEL